MEQILKVRTNETDGDEFGNKWTLHYVLMSNRDENSDGGFVYDLYEDDGKGNGPLICSGHNRHAMIDLTLKLGEFVEWGEPNLWRATEGAERIGHEASDHRGEA